MRAMELLARAELESIAFDAGNLALRHFRHVASERKADRTLVTAADREVEAFLVAALRSRLPEAGILGEEGTVHDGRGSYRIVLDPIDGTAAFVAGLPTWCICIGGTWPPSAPGCRPSGDASCTSTPARRWTSRRSPTDVAHRATSSRDEPTRCRACCPSSTRARSVLRDLSLFSPAVELRGRWALVTGAAKRVGRA